MNPREPSRRCTECSGTFEPDPRVGDRQVTCGAAECQARRHASKCRAWREANAEVASRHYGDVVVPFRRQRPWYQRGWRFTRRVGEIREEMKRTDGALVGAVRALVVQAERLLSGVPEGALSGRFSEVFVKEATEALIAAADAFEVVERSMAKLAALGS